MRFPGAPTPAIIPHAARMHPTAAVACPRHAEALGATAPLRTAPPCARARSALRTRSPAAIRQKIRVASRNARFAVAAARPRPGAVHRIVLRQTRRKKPALHAVLRTIPLPTPCHPQPPQMPSYTRLTTVAAHSRTTRLDTASLTSGSLQRAPAVVSSAPLRKPPLARRIATPTTLPTSPANPLSVSRAPRVRAAQPRAAPGTPHNAPLVPDGSCPASPSALRLRAPRTTARGASPPQRYAVAPGPRLPAAT